MADKEVAIKINVDADGGAKSLSELKREFKETQKTLEGLTIGTKEYVNTLQRLGGIKDDIGDLNDTIKTFNPEGKIQAFGNVMGGVASGIQGAVGAMALFGVESEETQKMLLKVQAASAFAEGIKGVVGLGDSFKNLQLVLGKTALGQKLVTAGQWLWNAAMSANPIGLIIAGIAALVGAFALLSVSSEDAAADQARLNELEKEAAEKLDKHVAAIEKKNAVLNKASDFEIQLLKAKGATEEELLEAEKKRDEKRRLQLMYLKGFRGDLSAAESAELLALTQKQTLASAKILGDAKKEEVANKKKSAEEQKKIDEDKAKKEIEGYRKAEGEYDIYWKNLKAIKDKADADKKLSEDKAKADEAQGNADALAIAEEWLIAKDALDKFYNDQTYAGKLENLQIQMNAELALVEGNEAAKQLIIEQYAKKESDLKMAQAEAYVKLTNDALAATQALTDIYFADQLAKAKGNDKKEREIRKKQFNVNKAFTVAGIVLNTVMGMIKAVSNNPPPSPIGIAGAVITGIMGTAATVKALATKFDDSGSGGGGGGALGSLGSAGGGVGLEPPQTGSTSLNADGTIKSAAAANAQPMIKAVVVETDITTSQKRVNTIEERASL